MCRNNRGLVAIKDKVLCWFELWVFSQIHIRDMAVTSQ